jgi:hypothetical protein
MLSSSLRQLARSSSRYVLITPPQIAGYLHLLHSSLQDFFLIFVLLSLFPIFSFLIRSFSSAAASTSNAAEIDWSAVRAKMMTDETRADADRAKEAFQKRLSAATSVGQVAEVDWSYFKKGVLDYKLAPIAHV